MFGRSDDQDDQSQHEDHNDQAIDEASIEGAMSDANDEAAFAPDDGQTQQVPDPAADSEQLQGDDSWQHPGLPGEQSFDETPSVAGQTGVPGQINDIMAPSPDTAAPAEPLPYKPPVMPELEQNPAEPALTGMAADSTPAADQTDTGASSTGDLADIKQQALSQLSSLADHLNQTPEEEFRTTMMMIQANDDQSLLQKAYAAAQQIADEKIKAQALLDIVNEINYFTHQHQNQQ